MPPLRRAAIDFGISNTDVVVGMAGAERHWTLPSQGVPNAARVAEVLAAGAVTLDQIDELAVTGGRSRELPDRLGNTVVVAVGEMAAIGRGGQLAAAADATPLLVVSCGSGTAAVSARGQDYAHVSGTAVGGGTLLGLSRLLLGTVDPREIDSLAASGDRNGVDLALKDVVGAGIGLLHEDTTAVNFGRIGRDDFEPRREDIAAGLVTLVGQTIGLIAINAARAQQLERIVLIGRLLDLPTLRDAVLKVGDLYGTRLDVLPDPGYVTALGALYHL
jgi:type II pantothenate kinase